MENEKAEKKTAAVEAAAKAERLKKIAGIISEIEKEFDKGAIMTIGDSPVVSIAAIPTGSVTLDMALGIGGVPRGRIIEVYGPESSGKTTLTLSLIAEAQKRGGICAMVDVEHAMDPEYAAKVGVNVDELLFSQPSYGEEALDIVKRLVDSESVALVVVDSLAALIPKAEIDAIEAKGMEAQTMGLQAKMMSNALRNLTPRVAKSGTTVIFINQLREKIGVMFGSPETTPGGKAMKFYASVRMDIRKIEVLKKGEDAVGTKVRVKVVKNKVAPPFREAIFNIVFGEGIDRELGILDAAVALNLVEKSGSWYSYGAERIGQGPEQAKAWLKDHVSVLDQLEAKIKDSYTELKAATSKKEKAA